MEEKMKKMLFLMLFLGTLGTVGTNAQVRIGGNGQPNTAAVLDLNATDAINNGTKGLALPRVVLTGVNTPLTGNPTVNGMMVYNTSGSLSAGVYYWDTNKWVKVSDGAFVEKDSIVGNEVIGAAAGGGLIRYGNGTASDPYMLGLDTTNLKIGSVMAWDGSKWNTGLKRLKTYRFSIDTAFAKPLGHVVFIPSSAEMSYNTDCLVSVANAASDYLWGWRTDAYVGIKATSNWNNFTALTLTFICVGTY